MNDYEFLRMGLYINKKGGRFWHVVTIDGFLVNALIKRGIGKKAVNKKIRDLVKQSESFDHGSVVITRQVKKLIVDYIMIK